MKVTETIARREGDRFDGPGWHRPLLAGLAQVVYSGSPRVGAWLLASVVVLAPEAALGMVLGLVAGTGLAVTLRWNRVLLAAGFFGYNGAMVGLAWPYLAPVTSPGFLLVVPAAIGATWLHGRLLPALTRRHLPVFAWPFVVVVGGASAVASLAAGAPVPWPAPDLLVRLGGGGPGIPGEGLTDLVRLVAGGAVLALALATASLATLAIALTGFGAALAASVSLGGPAGLAWVGAWAYTAVPIVLGICGVFFVATPRALVVAAVLAAASVPVWLVAAWTTAPVGLAPLTAVAHVVVLATILAARTPLGARVLGLAPRRLADAALPVSFAARDEDGAAPLTDAIAPLATMLRRSRRLVVISGAGMSTESGLPDYRSHLGFWYDANAEDLAWSRLRTSRRARRRYWRVHDRFGAVLARARPNAGHAALVALARNGSLLGIVTQNVDGLHQAAGVPDAQVVELHGSVRTIACPGCGRRTEDVRPRRARRPVERCAACDGVLRVDTVGFGEALDPARVRQATSWCAGADLLLVVGTSLLVAPAAHLPSLARARGVPIVVVNQTPTPLDPWAVLVVRGPCAAVLDAARRQLMNTPATRVIRPMTRPDFHYLCQVVDAWWGDQVRYLLHPLYREHFPDTCFVAEEDGVVAGFLIGFVSQAMPDEAYVHLAGTAPLHRGRGVGRALYEHFFGVVRGRGCTRVGAVTVPYNAGSIAFHRRLGFRLREDGAAWIGDLPVYADWAGPGVDCVRMQRTI